MASAKRIHRQRLTERERDVLSLRRAGCTFPEIGNYLGVTQPRAYQIFVKAKANVPDSFALSDSLI
jgi:DNA-directed RNA polymerase sigma subunit (sigma70/sigma32)